MKRETSRVWMSLSVLAALSLLAISPSVSEEPASSPEVTAVEIDPDRYLPRNRGLRRSNRPLDPIEVAWINGRPAGEFSSAGNEYVRFDTIPSRSLQRVLRRQGVLLTGYAGNNTYYAAINESGRQYLDSVPGIRSAGPIPIEDKLQPELLEGKIGAWAKDGPSRVLAHVVFHDNVALADARAVLEAHGGTVLDDRPYLVYFMLDVSVGEAALRDLAGSDLVRKISMKSTQQITMNANAAETCEVADLWDSPYDLDGAGYAVGVWDAGSPYPHPEFASRIIFGEGGLSSHSTHVTGTIAASGTLGTDVSARAHGMANQVSIAGYDYFSYNVDFVNAIVAGQLIGANNGWGYAIGWYWWPGNCGVAGCLDTLDPPNCPACPGWDNLGNDEDFGRYSLDSFVIDQAAEFAERTGKTFPVVWAAGNERADGPDGQHDGTAHSNPDIPTNPYYDTMGHPGCAKNNITVGSVQANGEMTDYSSWGPCDDSRIKPDLVAKGHALESSFGADGYQIQVGTSMATGVVTGSAVLVTEQYVNTFGTTPTNGELKALLINSTLDLGPPGPDYVYGYGLLQTRAAVELIRSEDGASTVNSGVLFQTQTDSYNVELLQGTPSFKCTLAWMDDPGVADTSGPALVNDLDLRLISPSAEVYYPFSLDAGDPLALATATGPNNRDTVEQIVVDNPETGTWTIEVRAQSVPSGPQIYGIAASRVLAAPKVFDVLPPNVQNGFPYPYRYPTLSAKFVDPAGLGIDPESVSLHLLWIDVTDDAVITADGMYYEVPWELWEDQQDFTIQLTNVDGLSLAENVTFDLVETELVENLTVAAGGSGEMVLDWNNSGHYSATLVPQEYRIYRSTNLQQELEWIGTTPPYELTFTDDDPPMADLVTYEVHARFNHIGLYRVLSTRSTPHRTQQPFIASPRESWFESLPSDVTDVRVFGMSEPGSEVTVYFDGISVGSTTTLVDGSFALTHDVGAPGPYTVHVQAKSNGKSLSVPSVEVDIEALP